MYVCVCVYPCTLYVLCSYVCNCLTIVFQGTSLSLCLSLSYSPSLSFSLSPSLSLSFSLLFNRGTQTTNREPAAIPIVGLTLSCFLSSWPIPKEWKEPGDTPLGTKTVLSLSLFPSLSLSFSLSLSHTHTHTHTLNHTQEEHVWTLQVLPSWPNTFTGDCQEEENVPIWTPTSADQEKRKSPQDNHKHFHRPSILVRYLGDGKWDGDAWNCGCQLHDEHIAIVSQAYQRPCDAFSQLITVRNPCSCHRGNNASGGKLSATFKQGGERTVAKHSTAPAPTKGRWPLTKPTRTFSRYSGYLGLINSRSFRNEMAGQVQWRTHIAFSALLR